MRRLFSLLLAVILFFCFCGISIAQKYEKGHNFGLSYNIADFNYDRSSAEKDGLLHGIALDYFNENRKDFFSHFKFSYLSGDVETDGEIENTNISLDSDTNNYIIDGQITAGKRINHQNAVFRPYIGFGIRYWKNDLSGVSRTISGTSVSYDGSESTYYYTPIGVMIGKKLNSKWDLNFNFVYKMLWSGDVRYNFSAGNFSDDEDVSYDFFDGHGLTGSVDVTYNFDYYSLSISPYINYWDFQESDKTFINNTSVYVYEPANETIIYGSKLTFNF